MSRPAPGQLIAGAGGAALIASLFLPWASTHGVSRTGWQLLHTTDVFLLIVGLVAITAAITGGHFGVFRPDVSLNGATDLFGVVATLLVTWLVAFDFPAGSIREVGVFAALVSAMTIAGGAGDYGVLRGAAWFPALPDSRPRSGDRTR